MGRVSCVGAEGNPVKRYFLNECSLGITADIIRHLQSRTESGAGLRYLRALPLAFRRFQATVARLHCDSEAPLDRELLALAAGNGRYFGSGLCIAPQATLDDGRLSCTLVGKVGLLAVLRNLRRLKRGIPVEHPAVSYRELQSIAIDSRATTMPLEADGEFLGHTPASIEILPGKIRFLM